MSFKRSTFRIRTSLSRRKVRWTLSLVILISFGVMIYPSSLKAQDKRVAAQEERPVTQKSLTPNPGNADILTVSDKDYQISAGDVIQIQIEDAPELSHFYRVNSLGRIEMPVLGLVEAQKKTTFELAHLIADGLREKEYLNTPTVLVTIKQYYSQTFFIQGSVRNPGVYQTEGRPSLLTMIGMAGGLAAEHGSTVFILRPCKTRKPEPEAITQKSSQADQTPLSTPPTQLQAGGSDSTQATDYELIKVNIGALYKGQSDQRLEPGDIINIPRADVFFVAGEVRAPGSFPLKEGTTLRQAISLAQGMSFNAKSAQGVIFREDPMLGSRQELKVDISAVMDGKKEDILIQANDVIIVPNSRTKAIGGMLLNLLGGSATRLPGR
ncbi:MAG: polysaccharide biosynthesis/export family protein [Acidobacteria bacterium]|nr:polysaccharide biosynthesis/export family protein [Acidobacteriota bacterium]